MIDINFVDDRNQFHLKGITTPPSSPSSTPLSLSSLLSWSSSSPLLSSP
jgi:hypothetical protein